MQLSGAGPAFIALAVFMAIGLALLLERRRERWLRRRRILDRLTRARDVECEAVRWLEDLGYSILGSQVACTYPVSIDRRDVSIALRADYIVERAGLRFVAEVKSGKSAPRIETPATRRQLLEYLLAFDVDGVLLVDGEERRVRIVRFPFSDHHSSRRPFHVERWLFILAALAGVLWATLR